MKKNFKRTLAKVMAVALAVGMVGTAGADADAAKKPKLAKKSLSIKKGQTKTVKIKNVKAKKVKKLTAKSSKKSVATVKKSGKTAIKVTGKKKGNAKITVKVTLKGKKKATKLTLKVKVSNAKKTTTGDTKTSAPATTASAAPSQAPGTGGTSNTAAPGPNTAAPGPDTTAPGPDTTAPGPDTTLAPYVPVAPTQPEKPSTPAKVLPELNLREEAATDWSKNGSYGTAIFNTDDSVSFNSEPWAEDTENPGNKKVGSCYNNGIGWYIDPATKGAVDLSMYEFMEVVIKTDAEIATRSWSGTADPDDFWGKSNETWGSQELVAQGADGTKTIRWKVTDVFGNAKKAKKAKSVALLLKSDKDGDTEAFKAREAVIYSITFVEGQGGSGTNPSGDVTTGDVTTGDVTTGDVTEPTEPIKTLDAAGYTSFASLGDKVAFDASKTYNSVTFKVKAYNAEGALITPDDENYASFQGYSKLSIGTEASVTNDNGAGYGDGVAGHTANYKYSWGQFMFNNIGKYGNNVDADGFLTFTLGLETHTAEDDTDEVTVIPTSEYDGFGFQSTTNTAGVPKVEIYSVTFNEVKEETPAAPIVTLDAAGYTSFASLGNKVAFDAAESYKSVTLKVKAYNAEGALITADDENYASFQGYSKLSIGTEASVTNDNGAGYGDGVAGHTANYKYSWGQFMFNNIGKYGNNVDADGFLTFTLGLETHTAEDDTDEVTVIPTSEYDGFGFQSTTNTAGVPKVEIYSMTFNK